MRNLYQTRNHNDIGRHRCRKGRGAKVLQQKRLFFLVLGGEKTNFTTFGPPGKILERSPNVPPGKNPSDTHVWRYSVASVEIN